MDQCYRLNTDLQHLSAERYAVGFEPTGSLAYIGMYRRTLAHLLAILQAQEVVNSMERWLTFKPDSGKHSFFL